MAAMPASRPEYCSLLPTPTGSASRRAGADARYTLANGRGGHFPDVQSLGRQDFIVAVDLDDRDRDARILLAAPLARDDIEEYLGDRLERTETIEWDSREQAVTARRALRLAAITSRKNRCCRCRLTQPAPRCCKA